MIFVTGATGNAGSHVVRALVEEGRDVRAFVRDREKAHACSATRSSSRSETLGTRGRWPPPWMGWRMSSSPVRTTRGGSSGETSAIDAAVAAGARRIVKLSTVGAEPGSPVAFWDWHGQVERHLRASGVPAAILRATAYMSNLLGAAEEVSHAGRLRAPAGEARIAMIDPRDVARAAAAVLTGATDGGGTYLLTGPEAITYDQVADVLSAATGSAVEFVDVTDEHARDGMIDAGMPDFIAEQIVEVFRQLRQGVAERTTSTVKSLTGRPPRSFAEFARDHAPLFAPAAVGAQR